MTDPVSPASDGIALSSSAPPPSSATSALGSSSPAASTSPLAALSPGKSPHCTYTVQFLSADYQLQKPVLTERVSAGNIICTNCRYRYRHEGSIHDHPKGARCILRSFFAFSDSSLFAEDVENKTEKASKGASSSSSSSGTLCFSRLHVLFLHITAFCSCASALFVFCLSL